MNLIYFALGQLIVMVITAKSYGDNTTNNNLSRHSRDLNLKILILTVSIKGKTKIINFIPTNQLLANHHLPVWQVSDSGHETEFHKLHDMMKKNVGHFTMYHDYETRSAIVYFHKRRQLDGIIKMKHKIEGVSVDKLNEKHKIKGFSHVEILNIPEFSDTPRFINNDNYIEEIGECQRPKRKIYPELLIAVSYDMLQHIEKESQLPYGVKTVSHVLIVYNIVDMLFKFVKSADISINIAGIVIESTENAWGFRSKLLGYSYINAETINDKLSEYFRLKDNINLRQYSYDYVVYHTRMNLLSFHGPLQGIGTPAEVLFDPDGNYYRYNCAIKDDDKYLHYSTIVHELSHVFGADHDRIFNSFFTNACDRSIMAAYGCPNLCLKFTDETEKELNEFFNSPAHCALINEPQSLHPDIPKPMLTTKQQCECFGYDDSFNIDAYRVCQFSLICKDEMKWTSNVPKPMDGTSCSTESNKVCWMEKCVESR